MYKELSSPPLSFACLPAFPSSSHPSSPHPFLSSVSLLSSLPSFSLTPSFLPPPLSFLIPPPLPLLPAPPSPYSPLSLLSFPSALLSLLLPTFFCPQHFIPPHVKSFFLFPHQHPTHSPKYPSHPRYSLYTPLHSPSRSTGRCTSGGGVASSRAAHPWGQL